MFEKVATVAVAIYVAWMLVSGRSVWWSDPNHPHAFWTNSRWVYRSEEPGLYWGAVGFHVIILVAIGAIAFSM